MVVFPQLSSGAGMQFPSVRKHTLRAASNPLRDGGLVSYADAGFSKVRWELAFRDVTDAEANGVASLFETVEGRRGTFTFIDPTANLLAHSEDFEQPCWTRSPMVHTSAGIDDPVGGSGGFRLTNTAGIAQGTSQELQAPASFVYAFSVYARSAGQTSITMSRAAGSNTHARSFALGPGWTRCLLSGAFNSAAETVKFALEIPAASAVDIYGIQAESQPRASGYKKTGARNGVYAARFDNDVLRVMSDGPDQHRFQLQIVAKD